MLKQPAIFVSAAILALFTAQTTADIVLSVAPPNNMDSYLSVLSAAWPRIYPQLSLQLQTAQAQVPAEYEYMLQALSISGVPSTYDSAWARGFVEGAQRIGPTTIYAKDIAGAMDDPAMQPTNVVTTDSMGSVATITNAPLQVPTIVVVINGNAVPREGQNAGSSTGNSDQSSSGSDSGSNSGSSSDGSSDSSSADSSKSSDAPSIRIPAALALSIISVIVSLI
ncbi:hypothetical protein GGI21_003585 [Coemansia aciculifera]|uniref:Uncharacterized protein n=1 Tax=Coemansia aciculifera TaxID=417176 RepID=A0ACC1M3S7_9FUNG|nr:hypothetical protein IWW38_002921 [Coemansia aciculifera]KAJ2907741.1 hypothetical protein GGI21_003585 [Coemansia aciculifera]